MKRLQMCAREALEKLDEVVSAHQGMDHYLYCAEAGGEVFYTEVEDHLRQLEADTPVTLVFCSEAELLAAALAEARGFLDRVLRELPPLADTFYAGRGSVNSLAQLAEALAWLQEVTVQLLNRGHGAFAGWPERLADATRELLRVAEEGRAADQGDFLLYELQGTLEGLRDRLLRTDVGGLPEGEQT